ncbi:MAG: M23 family metallopeptidase [Phycisphaerae bacterium]|nr:M23 family metallopeptidase [Phycisphaerae bacterium]NUQ44703.1 M23 family metallopeptidase [Phycisphaerae bacterium]
MLHRRRPRCAAGAAVLLLSAGCGLWPLEPPQRFNGSKYLLPWPEGKIAFVGQGFIGVFEPHLAYDFVLPEGTLVLAARCGVVTRVVDLHEANCPLTQDCPNNLIAIRHGRGDFADPHYETLYLHIQKGSALVACGEQVRQGQPIARVGNVGISMAPHIHFALRRVGASNEPAHFADIDTFDGEPQFLRFYRSRNGSEPFLNNDDYCDLTFLCP